MTDVDVLIPTRDRGCALALTLSGLAAQTVSGFRVVVSDQSEHGSAWEDPAVAAALRILRHRGDRVETHRHLPRRGLAEHRAYLLSRAKARYALFLDDDVWLEPDALELLRTAIGELRCGFVGMAVQGLSFVHDVRPHEHTPYEEWTDGVRPERVRRGEPAWERWRLHNAANLIHIAQRLDLAPGEWRAYKVAWIGACVLYDRAKLVDCGGFDFWPALPEHHSGEDVVAQLRVMERHGGAGILPSKAIHLEFPTTVPHRPVDCYQVVLGDEAPSTGSDTPAAGTARP
ncbi:glycosyl transferase [Carbonactinospora thermoautotrophica]|uniref:glycosyltransferase n=1 Tax=Carbonactinospora thermoautotrophica TaxID=1469144 RepID=UPI002271B8B4|nr:glycosyltransferase family 2 protein [Carbonactinospora thermoautotrophica]MCX9193313.1 glycosyl transferase [Carbonactinospora thermoautotrophica]